MLYICLLEMWNTITVRSGIFFKLNSGDGNNLFVSKYIQFGDIFFINLVS